MNEEKEPIVSIWCTTFNQKKYIRECLNGFILQQTNFKFEVIVHDDASTDGTDLIVREYEKKYPHLFRNIYQTENQFKKQNTLVYILSKTSKSKYIALCEGDDYWTDPYKLQMQVDFLESNEEYSFSFHQGLKINENDSSYEVYPLTNIKSFDAESFFKMPTIPVASIVFRRRVPLNVLKNHSHGDFLILCSLLSHGKAWFINEVMSVYRVHPSGVSYTHSSLPYVKKRLDELYIESNVSEFSEEVQKQIARIYMEHTIFMLTNYKKEIPRAERLGYLFRFMKLKKPGMNHWPYYKKLLGQILSSLVITLFIQ